MSGPEDANPVYIHFEFDNWTPHILEYPGAGDNLPTTTALPEKKLSRRQLIKLKSSTRVAAKSSSLS